MKLATFIAGIFFLMIVAGMLIQNTIITYSTNLNITLCHPIPVMVICMVSFGLSLFCFAVSYYIKIERVDFPDEIRKC